MNILYRKLAAEDIEWLQALVHLYAEVFERADFSMPPTKHLQSLLENDQLIFYTALSGNTVAGGLTAHVLPSVYFPASELYIYDLAVRTEYQRKGIGRQLIQELKTYAEACGHREVFVQAEQVDQHALDFYQAIGGQPQKVVHFTYPLHK